MFCIDYYYLKENFFVKVANNAINLSVLREKINKTKYIFYRIFFIN